MKPRNKAFLYLAEERLVTDEEIKHIERILNTPVDDISELSELIEDESIDFKERQDDGLEE